MERILLSLIVVLFAYAVEVVCFSFGDPLCSSHDSLALIQFKHSLDATDSYFNDEYCQYSSYPKTTSWNSTSMDCCRWDGVSCDSFIGHVIGLNLSCSRLDGTIYYSSQ
ncbi:hypothetical protein RDI58_002664 [Solanum bulbocastanum]|uniref:Leucine-rich repeat-containing N-terminal plant-type domain-containing protein n=1 Tax=Solanum bulbocastanum TaxID=147425 RepID=A0AAN8UET9_SOLBU